MFSALRFAPRFGAPTSSRTTSNGPCSSKPVGLEHLVGAELRDGVAGVGVADGGRDVRADRVGELDGRRADAARRAVDEQPLAGAQPRLGEERVVRGREDLGDPAGVGEPDGVGDRHELALVDDGELALAAAADDAHDAVALGEARRAVAEAGDLAGELEPGDVRRRAGRRGIAPAQLHLVGAVEAGGAHADEHLAGARLGIGVLLDEDLAVADRGGAHRRRVANEVPEPRSAPGGPSGLRPIWTETGGARTVDARADMHAGARPSSRAPSTRRMRAARASARRHADRGRGS